MVVLQATGAACAIAQQKCVTGRSPKSRVADQQVLAGIDAVTMTTEQLPIVNAGGR